jgi:hypothetical protein
MAVGYRGLARIAGGFLFVSLMCLSGPLALADGQAKPEQIPNGLLCTDQMETEPGYDDLDPIEVSDIMDAAVCQSSGTPVAI